MVLNNGREIKFTAPLHVKFSYELRKEWIYEFRYNVLMPVRKEFSFNITDIIGLDGGTVPHDTKEEMKEHIFYKFNDWI